MWGAGGIHFQVKTLRHCIVVTLLVASHGNSNWLKSRKSERSGERSQKSKGRTGGQAGRKGKGGEGCGGHSASPPSFSWLHSPVLPPNSILHVVGNMGGCSSRVDFLVLVKVHPLLALRL